MKKLFLILLTVSIMIPGMGQSPRKISTYLQAQYNNTLNDYTKGNNPRSLGAGIQCFLNTQSKFKPTAELTGDVYLEDDKVLRLNPDGNIPKTNNTVRNMVNLFAGPSFHPTKNIYLSVVTGPSFISGQTYWGIKPSLGCFFSKNQKWTGKISYINVFNREKMSKEDFGSLSLALGFRLF